MRELDRRVGPRRRGGFIATAVRTALDDDQRWELVESAFGAIKREAHDWEADPTAWVQQQRRIDAARVG